MTQVTQIPLATEKLDESPAAGTNVPGHHVLGSWIGDRSTLLEDDSAIHNAICDLNQPVYVVQDQNQQNLLSHHGEARIGSQAEPDALSLTGFAPASSPRQLGDISFCEDHGLRFPYMCGAMANGIASIKLVEAAANSNLLASFGAAGLTLGEIENAAKHLTESLGSKPFCFNLIFSPNEKGHEDAVVSLYLKYGIQLIETSAYMKLTLPAVRYRVHGIHRNADGVIETPNRIIA